MAKGFILGFIVAIAAVAAAGYFLVTTGALPARQETERVGRVGCEDLASRDDSSRGSGVKVPCPTD
jgi:hydrogenase/urease accessory protein HupE